IGAVMLAAICFYVAEAYPVHITVRLRSHRETHTISFNELALAIGLVTLTPATLVVAAIAGSAVALIGHRRQRGIKLGFNVVQIASQCVAATLVFDGLHG